jgi:hypothetical protein
MLAGLNYFISYYDHSAAKWRLWFDWKARAQDRECLRCKHKGNEYKHYCQFHAGRFIKINRLSSFFSEICWPKFSKLQCLYVGALLIDVQRHHRTAYSFSVVRRKSARFSIMRCNPHLPWLLRYTLPIALLVNRRNNLRFRRP